MHGSRVLALLIFFLPIGALTGQAPHATDRFALTAHRTTTAPVLDGRDADSIWQVIPATTGFREVRPLEDGEPDQRTSVRIAYDSDNLYVFVRAYDTAPDSIVRFLSRRDDMTASDQLIVAIDSYHDRRTGFEFAVNPANVKADVSIRNDGEEDGAWDGIWDVATLVDSAGWTAEYRIPFSQLRYTPGPSLTMGLAIYRKVARTNEEMSWPLLRPSMAGFPSQMADLVGIEGIGTPRRLEMAPYVLTENSPGTSSSTGRGQSLSVGGDLRYSVAPNLTLNATINPDFGQVEADPAQLNLSAFETFFEERRPFFVADAGLFDFRVNCFATGDCNSGEGLFYSRRIGRAPTLGGGEDDPAATRILGAAKLTGRLGSGLSLGVMSALTSRAENRNNVTIEPRASYSVLRANQDFDGGTGSIGVMVTATNRSLDDASSPYLHASAYTGGLDARRRLGRYEFSGSLMASRVGGSAEAIALTQRRPAHYYQRPDDNLTFDSTRTSLTGYAAEVRFGKTGGQRTRFETGYARRTAGFEINDIGFLRSAGQQTWTNWFALTWNTPTSVYRNIRWNFNWWQVWSLEGLPTERAFNTNTHIQFANRWWLHIGGTAGLGTRYCDRNCTRGGPALRVEPGFSPWLRINGDQRRRFSPSLGVNYQHQDGGRSTFVSIQPELDFRVASNLSTSIGAEFSHNRDDSQWFENVSDAGGRTHYTFAALDQRTVGLTWRLDYTISPSASFQFYANPFVSKGTYSRVRELADPRADRYEDRFTPYQGSGSADPGGFNVRQFRSNAVFRWEYRPGSTLFLVWSQGREGFSPREGDQSMQQDFSSLFDQRAEDRFLVKLSYWLNK